MSKKITLSQVASLIYILILFNYIGTTSDTIIPLAKQDAWLSIIITFIIGIIPLFIFLKIMDYEPDLSIIEKNKKIFGKFFGNVINILLSLFFIFLVSFSFHNTTIFLSSQYLHRTPTLFIALCTSVPIIYLLSKDFSVILKTLFILALIGIILYLLGFFSLIFQIRTESFKPFLEYGITNPFIGGIKSVTYNILPLFLITLIPKNKIEKAHNLCKTVIITYTICFIVMFLIVFITIGVFGPKLSALYQYSAFQLLKNITVFGSINRIESTISIRWILYIIGFIVLALYFVLETINTAFKLGNKIIKIIVIFVLPIGSVLLSEWLFENNVSKIEFSEKFLPFVSCFFLFLIPLIILIFSKLKKTSKK